MLSWLCAIHIWVYKDNGIFYGGGFLLLNLAGIFQTNYLIRMHNSCVIRTNHYWLLADLLLFLFEKNKTKQNKTKPKPSINYVKAMMLRRRRWIHHQPPEL